LLPFRRHGYAILLLCFRQVDTPSPFAAFDAFILPPLLYSLLLHYAFSFIFATPLFSRHFHYWPLLRFRQHFASTPFSLIHYFHAFSRFSHYFRFHYFFAFELRHFHFHIIALPHYFHCCFLFISSMILFSLFIIFTLFTLLIFY
jgi:hypothetical protein